MFTKRFWSTSLLAAVSLLGPSSVFAEVERLESYFPADTIFSLGFSSLESLESMTEGELWEELTQSEQWESMAEPMYEELDDMFGHLKADGEPLTWEKALELYPGKIALGLRAEGAFSEENNDDPEILLIAEYGGTLETLIELSKSSVKEDEDSEREMELVEEEYRGVTLYLEEMHEGDDSWISSGWALVNGLYVEGEPIDMLKEGVERILETAEADSLGDSTGFQDALAYAGEHDVFGYLNLAWLAAEAEVALKEGGIELPPNFLGVTMERLITSLRLDVYRSLYLAVEVDERVRLNGGLLFSEKAGLLNLLTYSDAALSEPDFIPEGALSVSVSNFNFGGMLAAIEGVLNEMSPNFGSFFQLQLDNIQNAIGVDLRQNLLENFGRETISYSTLQGHPKLKEENEEGDVDLTLMNQIYVFEVLDAEAFQQSITTLSGMFAPGVELFEEREYLGSTIYTPKGIAASGADNTQIMNYVFKDNYLFIAVGNAQGIEEALQHYNSDADSFWSDDSVQSARELLPEDIRVFNYSNLSEIASLLLSNLQTISDQMGNDALSDMPFDVSELGSSFKFPYFLISGTQEHDDALVTDVYLVKTEEE